MRKGDIDKFFHELSKKVRRPLKIYITGGVASWFMGGDRPTQDIDFAVRGFEDWEEVSAPIQEVSRRSGVAVQFSEDISRWGMIGFSDFEKGAKLYKRFGSVWVYLLDPIVWSVGKMARYTLDDLADLVAVFKKQKPNPQQVARLWAQALRESPRSSEQNLFVKKVEDFLKNSGSKIWGKEFEWEKYFLNFRKEAGLVSKL